uniref:Uncharacterized protein n=1 Tax=Cannabis sativa TaxID=3483 RepID=A0A803PRL3_CANSA
MKISSVALVSWSSKVKREVPLRVCPSSYLFYGPARSILLEPTYLLAVDASIECSKACLRHIDLDEAKRVLDEAKEETHARVTLVAKCCIYKAWLMNLGMDLSFLGEATEEMLKYFKKSKEENRVGSDKENEAEVAEEEEEDIPSKSPTI